MAENRYIENKEILTWKVIEPTTNEPIIYTKTKKEVLIKDIVREEERKIRIAKMHSKRKCAFNQNELILLQQDRNNGMSIRSLATKYNKSTRTIQKYLKL